LSVPRTLPPRAEPDHDPAALSILRPDFLNSLLAAAEAAEGPAREIAQAVVPEPTGDADDELLRGDQRAAAYFAALHTLAAGGTTDEAREVAAQAAAQAAASRRFTGEEDDITIR
jgi:hypothetical protein